MDVIQSDKNGGYSYGNNYGAFYLIDKYMVDILVIVNPDVEFTEAFLIRVVQDMINWNAQAASGYMDMPADPSFVRNRKINSYWQELLLCTVLLKQFVHFHNDYVLPNHGINQVKWIPGSLFAIEAAAYKNIHGLDDRVFLYYEEQILGKKFLKLGYRMIIDTDISYLHNHSVSIDKSIKRYGKTAQLFKSRYYFYANYEQINFWQRVLMKAFICYGLAARKVLYNFFS